ncbi:MAG: DUF447 domain-containing protein, partial [Promethearchaeota archaeon]
GLDGGCIIVNSEQLEKMGFVEGDIVESIVTTISKDQEFNAAPMGVWVHPDQQLIIRPYEGTQTASNIQDVGDAVINITHDPHVFLITAFKEELSSATQLEFEPATKVKAPRLAGMSGYLEVTIEPKLVEDDTPRYMELLCTLKHIEIASPFPLVLSRARCAAIECIIYATRVRAFHAIDEATTQKLVNRIDDLRTLVDRIAAKSPAAKVIQKVIEILPRWTK